MCEGRLRDISWFRATWQHGGAATGFSTWSCRTGREIDCVVKLPVNHAEYFWTKRLGLADPENWDSEAQLALPTPRVLAAGFELGGYDLAWIVIEKLQGPPLASDPNPTAVWEIFETAAEFHGAAIGVRSVRAEEAPPEPDWCAQIDEAIRAGEDNALEPLDRWRGVLSAAREHAPALAREWSEREINTWCHRDLHGRNAMRRMATGNASGRCVLIDLACVRPGHWVEDALYLARLGWGQEDLLGGGEPVTALARARSVNGLGDAGDEARLADVRRVLMAASSPAFMRTEGDPVYLARALEILESRLPVLAGG